MGTDIEKLIDLMIQERMQNQFAKWRKAETDKEKKADENGQLTDVQPHILFRPQMGRKPSNGTGWAAFSLLALLLWGHIIRLWFGFAPHIIWVFKQFGQVQYPQKSRKVLG